MSEILSYGGGTQTVAMCLLVMRGLLPKPDAIIAADTGREMPTTWAYANEHMQPRMAAMGLALHIAPHSLATVDLYAHNGDLLVPTYTATGKLQTYCSNEWKARVVERYARRVLNLPKPYVNWIGFSLDEAKRVKGHGGRRYPLLDLHLTRADCLRIIADAGLPPLPSRAVGCVRTNTTPSGVRCGQMQHFGRRPQRLTRKYATTTSAGACGCTPRANRYIVPTLTPTTATSRRVSVG